MNEQQLRAKFPYASESFIRDNADNRRGLRPAEPKRQNPKPLGKAVRGEKESLGRVTVGFTFRRVRLLDPDGAAASSKDLLDGLRHAELISDDNPAAIKLEIEQVKVSHRKEQKTEIIIDHP